MTDLKPAVKIAYISDQQFPVEKADAEQVVHTVSALTAEGMRMLLVIPRDWKNFGVPKKNRLQKLTNFYHLKNGLYTEELIHLPLTKLRFEKQTHGLIAPLWAKWHGFEIVYTRNPLPAFFAIALGLRVVFETYRFYGKTNRWLGKALARLSHSKKLLGFITHSKLSRDSLINLGVDKNKLAVIHNGFNPGVFEKKLSKAQARDQLNLTHYPKLACYTGRLDRDKGIETLLELAVKMPEITFLFIGKSQKDPTGWIDRLAAKKGLQNVITLPWMPAEKLAGYLFAADVLLIPPTAAPLTQHGKTVLPIKVFSYLAAGRVILAPRLPDSEGVLTDKNSVLVEPDNPEKTAAAMRGIFSDSEWADRLADQAQKDAQQLTWQSRAKKIIAFINKQLESH